MDFYMYDNEWPIELDCIFRVSGQSKESGTRVNYKLSSKKKNHTK